MSTPGETPTDTPSPPATPGETPGAAPATHPWPLYDALDGTGRASGILPCGRCGRQHADENAASQDRVHDELRRSAALAGWGIAADGAWCCPGCLSIGSETAAGGQPGDLLDLHLAFLAETDAQFAAARDHYRARIRLIRRDIRHRITAARAAIRDLRGGAS